MLYEVITHLAVLALGEDALDAELPREFVGDDDAAHRGPADLRDRQILDLLGDAGENLRREFGEAQQLCALAVAAAVPPGGEA